MARIETWFNQDLRKPVKVQYLDGNVFSQDNNGNVVGVNVFDNGQPLTVSGTVSANVIRADGATVAVTGSSTSNKAYVVLPSPAYAVPGPISIIIKLTSSGDIITLCAVVANVYQSSTDSAVDPGTIIPSISALIAEIENVAATIPLDYSELSNAFSMKAIINDLIATGFGEILHPLDSTGVTTSGKAWKADKTQVTGSQYMYITYNVPSSYAGNIAVIYGHGWGKPYPLVCFYDSNMNLICSAGERADTAYKGLPIIIPPATQTIVINGRTSSAYTVGIYFALLSDAVKLFEPVLSFSSTISPQTLTDIPSYADVKNLPANCIFNIGSDVYSNMLNLPPLLSTYATILKVSGGGRTTGAYCTYLCANDHSVWIGFETASNLIWHLLKGNLQRKYLFIGDSYGDGYSHDGNNSGWCEYLATELGLSSSQYESKHQGGSGFGNGGFLARLNSATGTGFTDIVVLGGFNDHGYTAQQIMTGIGNFCSGARSKFPSAKIHIGCVAWIKQGTGESAYQNWQEVRGYITDKVLPAYQACARHGAEYIAFSEYLLNDALMTPTDGYHPGEDGNKAIAHGVMNGISTGCACLPFNIDLK